MCAKADAFLALSLHEPQLRCPLHTSPCQAAPGYAVFDPKSDAGQDFRLSLKLLAAARESWVNRAKSGLSQIQIC